jgi:isoleucyl-tRNA synthetase
VWGVPIPVFYCESCNAPVTEKSKLMPVIERFRRETADAWYRLSPAELMGEGVQCAQCGGLEFRKETDILDVWFDSGASHLAVLEPNGLDWPSDMYLEGGDQYRGWFHSSLLIGVGLRGGAPYREIVTNGWTLDEQGRAMSKSLGNVIEPERVIKKYGADVLRLWVASIEYSDDVRLSDTILERLAEAYRKMRNTIRYALGAIHDFDHARHAPSRLTGIDGWIVSRAQALVERTLANYAAYRFHWAYQDLYQFCVNDLSAVYFDVSKDRLYTEAADSPERRSAQAALYRVAHALVRLMAPLLAFTADEAWAFLKREGEPDSVHLAEFPKLDELAGLSPAELADWDGLLAVREQVTKALEVSRQEKLIGAPLEAQVHLAAGGAMYDLLGRHAADLPGLFIVSAVELEPAIGEDLAVHVARADGQKCERCWKFKTDVGVDPEFSTICFSCSRIVAEMLAAA